MEGSHGRKSWKGIGRVRILGETRRETEGDIGEEYKKGIAVGSLRKESGKEVGEGSRGRKSWKGIGRVRILGETRRETEGDIGKEYKKGIAVGSLRKESGKKVVEGSRGRELGGNWEDENPGRNQKRTLERTLEATLGESGGK